MRLNMNKTDCECWPTFFCKGLISCHYGINNYNLFCLSVCQEASDVMLQVSFLSSRFTRDLLEPKEPFSSFVASYQPHIAVQVIFQDHKDNVMRAAGYYGLLLCTQGTFCSKQRGITLIKSTQIRWFSRWSGGGCWSSRAIAQWSPTVSKLGLKGPFHHYSNEIAGEVARRGPVAKFKGYSHRKSSQEESWTTAVNLTVLGQKAAYH
jgi:hypothetical protein